MAESNSSLPQEEEGIAGKKTVLLVANLKYNLK